MKLAQAFEDVLEAIRILLLAKASEAEDGVTVVLGEAVRPVPQPPAMWIYTDTARLHGDSTTLREVWELPVVLVSVTQDSGDPRAGQKKAAEIAADARSDVLATKNLGLNFVNYIESTAFEPRTRFPAEGGRYSAGAAITVTFTVKE